MRALLLLLASLVPVTSGAQGASPWRGAVLLKTTDVALEVPASVLQEQYQALISAGATDVTYDGNGFVREVKGPLSIVFADFAKWKVGHPAPEVLAEFAPITLTVGTESLTVSNIVVIERFGARSVRFDQSIRGRPVFHGYLQLMVEESSGVVRELYSRILPDRELPAEPEISAARAVEHAAAWLEGVDLAAKGSVKRQQWEPFLGYFAGGPRDLQPTLVWAVDVDYVSPDRPLPAPVAGPRDMRLYIDAIDGECLGQVGLTSPPRPMPR